MEPINHASAGVTADIPENSVTHVPPAVEGCNSFDPKRVRPLQVGENVRKYISRRLAALSEHEIGALVTALRKGGVGTQGRAEALAIFHQRICDEWKAGLLAMLLACIKVDEKNCFGMIEWSAVRNSAASFLAKRAGAAAWKHRAPSHVEEGVELLPKDRGAV